MGTRKKRRRRQEMPRSRTQLPCQRSADSKDDPPVVMFPAPADAPLVLMGVVEFVEGDGTTSVSIRDGDGTWLATLTDPALARHATWVGADSRNRALCAIKVVDPATPSRSAYFLTTMELSVTAPEWLRESRCEPPEW